MKLFEVPRNTWVLINGMRVFFERVDGMYSVCRLSEGELVHPAAWTECEVCSD